MEDLKKIAVVIDADNTRLSKLGAVLEAVSARGRILVKRAYGNWKKDVLKNWEPEIKRLAIKAEQQFDYVSGKNATDIALIIASMELLFSKLYDTFVIVSSDSDYTPLAIKMQEYGVYVMGVGERKAPEAFQNACDEFLYLEELAAAEVAKEDISQVHRLLHHAYDSYQKNGYVLASVAGNLLRSEIPDFRYRSYGFSGLQRLLQAYPGNYEIVDHRVNNSPVLAYRCLQ